MTAGFPLAIYLLKSLIKDTPRIGCSEELQEYASFDMQIAVSPWPRAHTDQHKGDISS